MVKGSGGILERKMAPFLDDVDHIPDLDTQVHRDIFVIEKIFSFHSLRNLPSGFQCQVFQGKGRMERHLIVDFIIAKPFHCFLGF